VSDVSVRTAWEVLLPAGTQLVGGESGLDRPVTWPVVLRTHPPAFDPLRGGELAIVPLDRLHLLDSSMTLGRVVTQLARTRIGAVCAIGPVGDDAISAADSVGVPLFRLPDGSSAAEVHQAFMRSLAEHRVQLSQRIGDIGRELTALAIEGRGRSAVVRRAGQLADVVMALEDELGRPLAVYAPPGGRIDRADVGRLLAELRGAAPLLDVADEQRRHEELLIGQRVTAEPSSNGTAPAPRDLSALAADGPSGPALRPQVSRARLAPPAGGPPVSALLAPVWGRPGPAGRLIMLAAGRDLVGLDQAILEQAVAACAIDLAREEAASAARDELQGDFLDDLLRGSFPSDDAIERRGRNLGHELTQPHVVLAVASQRAGGEVVELARRVDAAEAAASALAELLAGADGVVGPVAARARGDVLVALVPVVWPAETGDPVAELAQRVIELWGGSLGALWGGESGPSVGLGGVGAGGRAIAEAVERAVQAAAIGARLFGPGTATAFEDLGLYRLLFGLRGLDEVAAFYREMLGHLIEHDRRTGGELVRTLDAYLSAGCSPTAAAERLHLHRNGLLYRLQRIREILPVNLDDPERRLALHLALRIGDVLEPGATAQVQRIA
jgi:purine catabolism regulator